MTRRKRFDSTARVSAVAVFEDELKARSDAYVTHLVHGGKADCGEEFYLDALYMAISALREQSVPDTDVVKNNAQRIRSMTDEELSVLLSKPWCENHRLKEERLRFDTDCQACVADWLKQPYGGDT